MDEFDFDLFVIGGGSGGVRAARVAAGLGARVGLCEDRPMGGTCVNLGCVPKKLFMLGARLADAFVDARGFGWQSPGVPAHDWRALVEAKNAEIARLNGLYVRLLTQAGVAIHAGRGRLLDGHTVEVRRDGGSHTTFTSRHLLVAVGGRPWVPDLPGMDLALVSDDMFFLPALPRRAVVSGGGYIGVEFASILRGYGVDVQLVHRGSGILRGFDAECAAFLQAELEKRGVRFHLARSKVALESAADGSVVTVLDDGARLESDLHLCALGRVPNTEGLGLAEAGVLTDDAGFVQVDDHCRTSQPSVYAVGDVVGRAQLTPVALAEGMAVAHSLFGAGGRVDYRDIPTTVFSLPNLATVGLTEEEARTVTDGVRIYTGAFRSLQHTLTGRDARTLVKVVVEHATDRVVGFHMVGDDAGEVVQGLAVALRCGVTKAQLDSTLGIHPTTAEEFVTLRTPTRT